MGIAYRTMVAVAVRGHIGSARQGNLRPPRGCVCAYMVADISPATSAQALAACLDGIDGRGRLRDIGFPDVEGPNTVNAFELCGCAVRKSGSGYFFLSGLIRCLAARESLFVFAWLLPLGLWRLGRLPRTWVIGSACAAGAALAMGAYDDAMGNTVRPLFSIFRPIIELVRFNSAGRDLPTTK